MIFQDAIHLALAGCKFSWAAQVLQCFSALGEPLPLVADAPIAIDIDLLQKLFLRDRLASFDSLPQDPRLALSAGVKLCTYYRWFGRSQNAACPSYWESPMGNAKLHRILRFRKGSHHLPVEESRHFNLPRASRVCNSGVQRIQLYVKFPRKKLLDHRKPEPLLASHIHCHRTQRTHSQLAADVHGDPNSSV